LSSLLLKAIPINHVAFFNTSKVADVSKIKSGRA
jgi:hypothetical protein